MANRQQRRAAEKANRQPRWMPKTFDERRKALIQNGITPEYVYEQMAKARREGYLAAGEDITKGCYAAVCLALHDLHGFGHKRLTRVLREVDGRLTTTLGSEELIEDVLRETGIHISFAEGVDRIQER